MGRETVPVNGRIYLTITPAAAGKVQLGLSRLPPTTHGALAALISRGVLMGDAMSMCLDLVSDATQNEALRGPAGKDGKDGRDGTNGTNGADGLSAYQVARSLGYGGTATQWLTTLVGGAGKDGTNGKDGAAGKDGTPATTLLGSLTITETMAVAITAGLRRVTVTTPAAWNVKVGDDLVFAPMSLPTGNYALHNAIVTAANTVSVVLTVPALALLASYSIPCRVRRLN